MERVDNSTLFFCYEQSEYSVFAAPNFQNILTIARGKIFHFFHILPYMVKFYISVRNWKLPQNLPILEKAGSPARFLHFWDELENLPEFYNYGVNWKFMYTKNNPETC